MVSLSISGSPLASTENSPNCPGPIPPPESAVQVTAVTLPSLCVTTFQPGTASVSIAVTPGIRTANSTVGLLVIDSFGTRNTSTAEPPRAASGADTVTWADAGAAAITMATAAATTVEPARPNQDLFIVEITPSRKGIERN